VDEEDSLGHGSICRVLKERLPAYPEIKIENFYFWAIHNPGK
jgi:hypothetical protein